MYKFGCLVYLIVLYGLGFGSQTDECLFKKQHLAINLDWHKKISKPSSIASNKYYFFNRGISNLTLNDTIQMQGLQADASKVTFGKIVLEAVGSAAGATLGGVICYRFTGDVIFWGGAAVFAGVTVGLAGGTTIVGNLVMEPNGSFTKSLIGSTIGTSLGAGALLLLMIISGPVEGPETNWIIAYGGLSVAALFPVSGAVVGYNLSISGKSVTPMMNSPEENEFLDGSSQRHYPSIKLQLITLRF